MGGSRSDAERVVTVAFVGVEARRLDVQGQIAGGIVARGRGPGRLGGGELAAQETTNENNVPGLY